MLRFHFGGHARRSLGSLSLPAHCPVVWTAQLSIAGESLIDRWGSGGPVAVVGT